MKRFYTAISCVLLMLSLEVKAEIVVIVNHNNPIVSFDRQQIINLYMGRDLYFPDGKIAIRLDQLPTSEIRKSFYRTLVGMSVGEVKAYWARLLFSGRASPPLETSNCKATIESVATNEAAIGYILRDEVTDQVKIVGVIK